MIIERVSLPSTKGATEEDARVLIEYTDKKSPKNWNSITYSSNNEPLREFRAAMQALADDVMSLLEWPSDSGNITIRTVIIKNKDGERGVIINGTKHLSNSNTPFNFNTPYIHQAVKKEQKRAMSDAMLTKLDVICEQAEKYINGERSQEDLFDDDERKKGKGKKGNNKGKKQLELVK